ncbi:CD209 antigen-like protein 2 [Eulemur rufifrons]|uniref:CD209 antigen-like protein 2 n=1 Tax=Eulemur rufifrons TaxID=859984 RepID=UPI0037446FFB
MSDSKELGLLEEERLTGSSSGFFARDLGSHQTPGPRSSAGCLGRSPLVLLFLAFMLLAVLLVTIVVQVSKLPSSLGQEQSRQEEIYQELTQLKAGVREFPERSRQDEIYQELTQLKAAVDHLCRPCPWQWTFFQGNCYFFSYSQRNWHDSITACQDVGAQLVVIKGEEEQNFLQLQSSRRNRFSWIGMSDLTHEGTWQWVDGSPLPPSLTKHWYSGEPNNIGEEDCVEIFSQGWNDHRCDTAKFWICKKSAASCSSEEGRVPSSVPAAPTQSAEWQNVPHF